MTILTQLVDARLRDSVREIDGRSLTRPALLIGDGLAQTYAVDVAIDGQDDPLRNVPIAPGNRSLTYADAGAAVRLRRAESGKWTVVGFSKAAPGTYTRLPVTVASRTLGTAVSVGLSARPLTYGELATFGGGYGTAPYGAVGIFRGATLSEVR